jgi:hypothetical protein
VQAFHAAASTPKAVRVRDGELRDLLRQCGARTVIPIREAREGA